MKTIMAKKDRNSEGKREREVEEPQDQPVFMPTFSTRRLGLGHKNTTYKCVS